MPKIVGHTPAWLSRPSPGAKIFSDPEPQSPASPSKRSNKNGLKTTSEPSIRDTNRLITHRGSEVFVVVGNKIRWASLSKVKDDWEAFQFNNQKTPTKAGEGKSPYRTLLTPVYYRITQLVISPSELFLAICTEHTVHIAVLPDPSRLNDQDYSPIKLKTNQLGPTTHVIPEAPLASVVWHPLAASSSSADCLVTVTTEAAVRLWEFDRTHNWSFERPALAIDLRKLADGVSCDQDFEPSGFGKNRGFSADAFDMEVEAACFGGQGREDEDPWASMTLWSAMSNGDVYALCPLLPSRWQPTPTTIPALTTSTVSRMVSINAEDVDADERRAADQQYEWVQEIDDEDPYVNIAQDGSEMDEVRYRPQNPSAIPRLQGPFEIEAEHDAIDLQVSDIHVIAARLDEESLLSGEEDYSSTSDGNGLPLTTVCLSTIDHKIYIGIELEGVTGQWLPKKGKSTFSVPTSDSGDLILLEQLNLGQQGDELSSATFTPDPLNPYNFFVTSGRRVFCLSLSDWAARVGTEMSGGDEVDAGLHTRLAVACQGVVCTKHEILSVEKSISQSSLPTTAVVIEDANIGQLLLTFSLDVAEAVQFDLNIYSASDMTAQELKMSTQSPFRMSQSLQKVLEPKADEYAVPVPARAPYEPSPVFYVNQLRPLEVLGAKIPAQRAPVLTEKPIRLSPACLDIMAAAHRTFSTQTSDLEKAAAELFRRCERLRDELGDQVRQMSELADRLQTLHNGPEDEDGAPKSPVEHRLDKAQERQKALLQRFETVRRKAGRVGTGKQELSTKEISWIGEIDDLAEHVGITEAPDAGSAALKERFTHAKSLAEGFLVQSKSIQQQEDKAGSENRGAIPKLHRSDSSASHRSGISISSRLQRERINDVMAMVERESAIIEAVMSRLEKLNI